MGNEIQNNNPKLNLDTHAEFKRLVNEDIAPDQADAIIDVVKQLVLGSVATRSDFSNIQLNIEQLRAAIKESIIEADSKTKDLLNDYTRKFEEKSTAIEHRIGIRLESFDDELQSSEKKIQDMVEVLVAKISRMQSAMPDKNSMLRDIEESERRIIKQIKDVKGFVRKSKNSSISVINLVILLVNLGLVAVAINLIYNQDFALPSWLNFLIF